VPINQVQEGVQEKSQQIERKQEGAEMFFSMSKVVFDMLID